MKRKQERNEDYQKRKLTSSYSTAMQHRNGSLQMNVIESEQSFKTTIDRDTYTIGGSGSMSFIERANAGSLFVSYRRDLNDPRTQYVETSVGFDQDVAIFSSITVETPVSQDTQMAILLQQRPKNSGMTLWFHERLGKHTSRTVAFTFGQENSLMLNLKHKVKKKDEDAVQKTNLAQEMQGVARDYSHNRAAVPLRKLWRWLSTPYLLSARLRFGSMDYLSSNPFASPTLTLAYGKKLNKTEAIEINTVFNATLTVGIGFAYRRKLSMTDTIEFASIIGIQGLSYIQISYQHLKQSFVIPIIYQMEFEWRPFLASIIIPAFGILCYNHLWGYPAARWAKRAAKKELLAKMKDKMIAARNRAQLDARLMKAKVRSKRVLEKIHDGMVIIKAEYGNLKASESERAEYREETGFDCVIDVTDPIQDLVVDSQLQKPGRLPKSNWIGFYDPCPGDKKFLYIRYTCQGSTYEYTFADLDHLSLPSPSHKISNNILDNLD
eukprot:TRINITY_DN9976_c0_g1_i1.p1 TRINITY_DN9976_c0_g1~~TRINITY_DN9976_c0_g1_i1.p1  ORF type:complete len:494 (-),score=72.07 TRINITY_DN9976_c0_g1_i1:28-1509(-)